MEPEDGDLLPDVRLIDKPELVVVVFIGAMMGFDLVDTGAGFVSFLVSRTTIGTVVDPRRRHRTWYTSPRWRWRRREAVHDLLCSTDNVRDRSPSKSRQQDVFQNRRPYSHL